MESPLPRVSALFCIRHGWRQGLPFPGRGGGCLSSWGAEAAWLTVSLGPVPHTGTDSQGAKDVSVTRATSVQWSILEKYKERSADAC